MSEHAFRILNVFSTGSARLSGNPLCVFERGDGLDGATMQALARQFNLSETTFILPSERANAKLRIFAPDYEMPFAGHPTLGSAHVCRALGLGGDSLELEMQAGIIAVRAAGDQWTLQARPSSTREIDVAPAELAGMLGLEPGDIGARPLWVKAGKEQLIIPLESPEAVRRARPDPIALARLRNDEGQSNAYLFAATGADTVLARYFFPSGPTLMEDPATGSATANLGGWWLAMGRALPCRLTIAQGAQVQRPSTLILALDPECRILVSGAVLELGRGSLTL
jgi:PhzF family phenazine biosynthesis protein